MRPSFRRVRAGPMPWGRVCGERGRRRRVFKRGGEGGKCLREGEEGEGKKVGGGGRDRKSIRRLSHPVCEGNEFQSNTLFEQTT